MRNDHTVFRIYGDEDFAKLTCDIETKFAKFYILKSALGKQSIIKIFKDRYSDFFSAERFRLLQQVNSPLMIAVEYINDTSPPYVQYEYFESMTVKTWLQTSAHISKETLLSVLADMASIIDLLHEKNLVHLDIVGNFLISSEGKVKLSDYDYVEELNGSGKHKIDLHSFFELVYRLIYFLDQKKSTSSIHLRFDDSCPNYSTCKAFLNSLAIR